LRLSARARKAGGSDGDDLGQPTPDPGWRTAQKRANLLHLTSSICAGGTTFQQGRTTENGLARLCSPDAGENSNARFVRTLPGSGFVARI